MIFDKPIMTGTVLDVFIGVLVIAMSADVYFDINSTEQFLKRSTGHEGNKIMVWLMSSFPTTWPYAKALISALVILLTLLLAPANLCAAVLLVMAVLYYVVFMRNYGISK